MTVLNSILGILNIVAVIALVVLWIMARYGAITRKDLKNSRAVWILLLIFLAPIGTIAYFFSENRKKQGIIALVVVLFFIVVVPVLYTLIRFNAQAALSR